MTSGAETYLNGMPKSPPRWAFFDHCVHMSVPLLYLFLNASILNVDTWLCGYLKSRK